MKPVGSGWMSFYYNLRVAFESTNKGGDIWDEFQCTYDIFNLFYDIFFYLRAHSYDSLEVHISVVDNFSER